MEEQNINNTGLFLLIIYLFINIPFVLLHHHSERNFTVIQDSTQIEAMTVNEVLSSSIIKCSFCDQNLTIGYLGQTQNIRFFSQEKEGEVTKYFFRIFPRYSLPSLNKDPPFFI